MRAAAFAGVPLAAPCDEAQGTELHLRCRAAGGSRARFQARAGWWPAALRTDRASSWSTPRRRTLRRWYTGEPAQISARTRRVSRIAAAAPDADAFNAQGMSLRRVGAAAAPAVCVESRRARGHRSVQSTRCATATRQPKLQWIGCVADARRHGCKQRRGVSRRHDPRHRAHSSGHADRRLRAGARHRARVRMAARHARLQHGARRRAAGQQRHRSHPRTARSSTSSPSGGARWSRSRTPIRRKMLRKAVAPGFMPDNIHLGWRAADAAGMQYDEPACGGLRKIIDGKADPMLCHRGYTVAHLDPKTMTWSVVAYAEPNPSFNGCLHRHSSSARTCGSARFSPIGLRCGSCLAPRRIATDSKGPIQAVHPDATPNASSLFWRTNARTFSAYC